MATYVLVYSRFVRRFISTQEKMKEVIILLSDKEACDILCQVVISKAKICVRIPFFIDDIKAFTKGLLSYAKNKVLSRMSQVSIILGLDKSYFSENLVHYVHVTLYTIDVIYVNSIYFIKQTDLFIWLYDAIHWLKTILG